MDPRITNATNEELISWRNHIEIAFNEEFGDEYYWDGSQPDEITDLDPYKVYYASVNLRK
jgi:hypothetical protein